jgi:hypothetical protein
MKPAHLSETSCGILGAIAGGRSIFEILAADQSVTYHDIFHAVSEAPTSIWTKAAREGGGLAFARGWAATPACQRID